MELLKDRIVKLRNLYRLTQQDLSLEIHVSDKVISKWERGESEPSLSDVRLLSDVFKVSIDYIVNGVPSSSDKLILEKKPTTEELADDFINKCWEIIKSKGLQKYKEMLLPRKSIGDNNLGNSGLNKYSHAGVLNLNSFKRHNNKSFCLTGGVFKTDNLWEWKNVVTPYIDRKKLIALDNFNFYDKLKDLPTSYGEARFLAKQNNRQDILNLMPENHSSDFYHDRKIKPLSANDIKGATDIMFYKELVKSGQNELNIALNELNENNKNFWEIVKVLISNGAVKLIPQYDDYSETNKLIPDKLGTKLLLEMAIEKTKDKK